MVPLVSPVAIPAAVLALALAVACASSTGDGSSPSCAKLEDVSDRAGLMVRSDAEDLGVEVLAMSAPEVTGTEVERVWASCLTTFRSYEQDLLKSRASTSPWVVAPDAPVWIVEVKGISRPAGIATASASEPYRYAMTVMDAQTGDSIAGSRRQLPLLEPAGEE